MAAEPPRRSSHKRVYSKGRAGLCLLSWEEGCHPTEDRLCGSIRATIEAVFDEELDAFLGWISMVKPMSR